MSNLPSFAKETLDRLLLAKQLVFANVSMSKSTDRLTVAKSVLLCHDSAELAALAIAAHCGCNVDFERDTLMKYISKIEEREKKVFPGKLFFDVLNQARRSFKHHGVVPDPASFSSVIPSTQGYLDDSCSAFLGVALRSLGPHLLIRSLQARELYLEAKEMNELGKCKEALEKLARSFGEVLSETPLQYKVTVGDPDPAVALELTGLGVEPGKFIRLQEFLPRIDIDDLATWEGRRYGHAGNWVDWKVQFCLDAFGEIALKIQEADFEPSAAPYEYAFLDELTIKAADVVVHGQLNWLFFGRSSPLPVVGTLNEGDVLMGHAKGYIGPLKFPDLTEVPLPDSDYIGITSPRCAKLGDLKRYFQLFVPQNVVELRSVPDPDTRDSFPHLFETQS